MKTLFVSSVVLFAASVSAAPTMNGNAVNKAYVSGNSSAHAATSGPSGFSYSLAEGRNAATANGSLAVSEVGGVGGIDFSGNVKTSSSGYAFNIASEGSTGSASLTGLSTGYVKLGTEYYGDGQWVIGGGSADAGYYSNTKGATVNIAAQMNSGGQASAEGEFKFSGTGRVAGNYTNPTGTNLTSQVTGTVDTSHSSAATVNTGTVTVDSKQLTAAQTLTSVSDGVAQAWAELDDPR
jgi:hypothetical protein